MPKFKKKPVVVEAEQVKDSNIQQLVRHINLHGGSADYIFDDNRELSGLAIHTLEGVMQAYPGDWLIQGVEREFYPCKDNIFQQTYEPVDE